MSASHKGLRKAITRAQFTPLVLAITTAAGTTEAADVTGVSAWAIRSPDSSVTSVEVWASTEESGTYTRVQIDAVDLSVALSDAKWNNPDALVFAIGYIKLVGNAAGVVELVAKG